MTTLYERQPGETTKAYTGFSIYRDLGVKRSIESAWKQYNPASTIVPGYFKQWSVDYSWISRAAAYDAHVDAQARKQLEADAVKRKVDMLKRHALTGKVMQQKGVEYINKKGIDRSSDAIQSIKAGITIERQSEGLPEYMVEVVNTDDNELVRQYHELLAEVSREPDTKESSDESDPDV